MHFKRLLFPIMLIVTFLVVAMIYDHQHKQATPSPLTSSITFPTSSDVLIKGKMYTLAWKPSQQGETQIFLIDKAFESKGVSVSIVDRVYHLPDTGSYRYTIPSNIPSGTYKFTIGTYTSDYFSIR